MVANLVKMVLEDEVRSIVGRERERLESIENTKTRQATRLLSIADATSSRGDVRQPNCPLTQSV